ncbi:hypothetical protein ElyMa_003686000 [Elysia marginata]|uniref:Uncharacterized protein n=1 Tax=Elysia marginata TaxID=1093978 RepID=A0AAV4F0R3_9GAST|nr:hypothetical protein ElyMa_003686000 [Elysia marginata]
MADASNREKSEQEDTEKHETRNEPLSDEEERFLLSDQWYQPKQIEDEEGEEDGDRSDQAEDSAAGGADPAVRKTSREEVIQSMRRPTIPRGFVHQRVKQASRHLYHIVALFRSYLNDDGLGRFY